ncbi:MAG: hypothetical protein ACPGU7_01400 [Gammaproteobacteria bacterium]
MSLDAEIDQLEQRCRSSTDFLELLERATRDDALADDTLLHHRILDQAGAHAVSPGELMAVSEQALVQGRIPLATEYFERAQALAHDADGHMVIARALAKRKDQGQVIHEAIALHVRKAAEALERAAELAPILIFAFDELADPALCRSLIALDMPALRDFNDFCVLGRNLMDRSAAELARMVFERSSRLCNDMYSVIAYSRVLREQLHDPEAALAVLGDAEADCQTTEEFVELARAYRDLDESAEHVDELMELAEEFAIDLTDRVYLARGRFVVQNDMEGALATYREIIPELDNTAPLIRVGHDLAFSLDAPADALLAFSHARDLLAEFDEYMDLLHALAAPSGALPEKFRDFAEDICARVVKRFHQTAQLERLARYRLEVLDDPAGAGRIVMRAVEGARDEASLHDLIATARIVGKATRAEYLAYERLGNMSYDSSTLLELADQANASLGHRKLTRKLLEKAEANGRSPEQLERVASAIERHFPMDALWVDNLRSDIQGRRQVEERLAQLMDRLDATDTPEGILYLAHEAAVQFEDREVTRRCLERAEYGLLRGESPPSGDHVGNLIALTMAVSDLVGDAPWTQRLVEESLPRCHSPQDTFRYCRGVRAALATQPAIELHLAQQFRAYLARIAADPGAGPYSLLKAARAAFEIFADAEAANDLLRDARRRGADPLCITQMALLARQIGNTGLMDDLLDQALALDTGPEALARICRVLGQSGVAADTRRHIYARGRTQQDTRATVRWIVGIDDLFGDAAWSHREFQALLGSLPTGAERTRVRRVVRDRAFQAY